MEIKDKLERLKSNNAKKVFKGEIFDIYQWPQKMFDGSIATFERIVRPDTVIIFPVVGEKFIMNLEKQPASKERMDFPMGRMEPGEKDPSKSALRELKEETGIIPKELYFLGSERLDGKILWDLHFFIAKDIKMRESPNLDNGEQITNIEYSISEIYEKFKNLEIELPKILLKILINEPKDAFIDRFIQPEKYFEKI
jgi:ADP-ribose pyrophosphatase YjhB (NUDIX family)